MSDLPLADVIEAWSAGDAGLPEAAVDQRILGFAAVVRAIAERGRATPADVAAEAGLSPEQVSDVFGALAGGGLQVDDAGNVVGAALTVRSTSHRFRVLGQDLYAWCALDTLFLPGLLGAPADVRSTCPVSGVEIRLVVTPEGAESVRPASAVLSVVIPQAIDPDRSTGPASPT